MSKQMLAREYRDTFFAEPKPSMRTVRRWIDAGDLPGRRIGRRYYVYLEPVTHPLARKVLGQM